MIKDLTKIINKLLERKTFKNIYNNFFKDKLSNKIIKLSISDMGQEFYILFQNDSIRICNENNEEDVTISGTVLSLLFYSTSGRSELFASKIKISGDVETANALNNLLQESDILRDIIFEIIGQKSASTLFSILDPIKEKMDESKERNNTAVSDFLKFDINMVPSKEDINNYIDSVDDVKTRTEKLLSRFK
tara:strand:- start:1843 stop:2415 length:573 start_codon:yes stop_codon:yes gene_type:complete